MTGLLADATGSRELALDARVGALGLVVAYLATVEAFAGVLLSWLRAVARKVAVGATAKARSGYG